MLGYCYRTGTEFDIMVSREEVVVLMDYYYDMATKALNANEVDKAVDSLLNYSKLKGLLDEVDNPAE